MFRAFVILVPLLFAACAGQQKDGAPSHSVDFSKIPDAVPKYEPITIAGNKSPYTVLGKTYRVLPTSKGYREKGIGSWYGTKFHGRRTSNGEVYDMYKMTAAHKTLPIPSYVKVTNLLNGRSVIVRVNDRGPFHSGRVIDLSFAAASKLGYASSGTAPVEVVVIQPSDYQNNPVEQPSIAEAKQEDTYALPFNTYLQAGAFGNKQSAAELVTRLQSVISHPVNIRYNEHTSGMYKVLVGPVKTNTELVDLRDTLARAAQIKAFVVYH